MVMFGVAVACKAHVDLWIFMKFDWCQTTLGSFGDRGFELCLHYRDYAWDSWSPGNLLPRLLDVLIEQAPATHCGAPDPLRAVFSV